jgi:hypothetical protein
MKQMKKIAILCAMILMVGTIPDFAMDSNNTSTTADVTKTPTQTQKTNTGSESKTGPYYELRS